MKKIVLTTLLVLFVIFGLLTKDDVSGQPHTALKQNAVVLAFGDSITYGYKLDPAFSYPSQLAKKTGLLVINAGISGEESSEGLKRLPTLLKQHPDLVILCHGANDILRKRSLDQLKKNLLAMIRLIENSGAKVLLVGVPDFGWSSYKTLPLYRDIAEETGVLFEADVLGTVVSDPALRIDPVHPNEKGYGVMADTFIGQLKSNKVLSTYE